MVGCWLFLGFGGCGSVCWLCSSGFVKDGWCGDLLLFDVWDIWVYMLLW